MKNCQLILSFLFVMLLAACGRPGMHASLESPTAPSPQRKSPTSAPAPVQAPSPSPTPAPEPAPSPQSQHQSKPEAKIPPSNSSQSRPRPAQPEQKRNSDSAVKTSPKVSSPSSEIPAEMNPKDFVQRGLIIPSVYQQVFLYDRDSTCAANQRISLKDRKGTELIRICPEHRAQCLMQGSCVIIRNGIERAFNYASLVRGAHTFTEFKMGKCTYGYGAGNACLDPFYSVAADLAHHQLGDVIFVPKLLGRELPDGSRHSGFLVIRDSGGAIKGAHRFDFFSGPMHWRDPKNMFGLVGLSDQRTRLRYYKVRGETAQEVLKERNYPSFPDAR